MKPRHFPIWNPSGMHLLGEDGAGGVLVDDHVIARGYGPPVWFDDKPLFASDDPASGTFIYDATAGTDRHGHPVAILRQVHPRPLIELAAGGGLWAGRDPSRNVLVVSDGREIPNAGQPAIA